MKRTIISNTPVASEAGALPLVLTGAASETVEARIDLRSGAEVAYGAFDLAPGFLPSACTDAHLFVLVTAGLLEVNNGSLQLHASAGEAFVMPQGGKADWASEAGISAIFSSCADPAPAANARIVAFLPDSECEQLSPYPKTILIAGEPQQSGKRIFSDSTGRWVAGLWDSGPYHRKTVPFPKNEFLYLHCGSASFTQPDDSVVRQDRNASFVIAKNFEADWNSQVYVFKTLCADSV